MRKPINIDRKAMEQIFTRLEAENTYTNRNALFEAVSNEYHSAHGIKVNPSVIYLRVKEWALALKTPIGKRGRQKGASPIVQPLRGTKLKGNKSLALIKTTWEKDPMAKPFLPLLKKIENGSLKSAIKANCISCANFQRAEVKYCQVTSCPLHCIRPYQ